MNTVLTELTDFKTKITQQMEKFIFFYQVKYDKLEKELITNKEIQENLTKKLEELNQYKNVSLVKSLDKQLKESKQQNKILTKQLNSLKKKQSKQNLKQNNQRKNNTVSKETLQENTNKILDDDISSIKSNDENLIKELNNSENTVINEEKIDKNNDNENENDDDDEDELEVYEKKIKGVIYYMDNDKNVYKKLENDEIGPIIGIYKRKKICPI